MSHFSVLVPAKDEQELYAKLLPYYEYGCVKEYDNDIEQLGILEFIDMGGDLDYEFNEEHGTHGYYHNPNAKWDGYSVGGRFSGALSSGSDDYNPVTDPRNFEVCSQCGGKGCTFCDGTGSRLKWSSGWIKYDGDSPLAGDVDWQGLKAKMYTGEKVPVYAFIDLAGKWNQKGEMSWWGIDDKSKATPDYETEFWAFIHRLPEDQRVYVVDCHI